MGTLTESSFGADIAAGTSTPALLPVGDYFHGTISVSGDHDLIGLDVVAGQTYRVS